MPDYSWLAGDDPLSTFDLLGRQRGVLDQQLAAQAQGQKATFKPLDPAEEESALGMLGHKALAGIGYVGSLLDKYTGGRAVRGLLGGQPGELASILPFSDTLGLTDESKQVSGRDLTDQLGLTTKGGEDWTDSLLGVGADILTSPATFLTPGGLTKAGEAAAKIGALPKGLSARIAGVGGLDAAQAAKAAQVGVSSADVLHQPLASALRFHVPFTGIGADIGTGAGTLGALGKAGKAAGYLAHQTPLRYGVEPLQAVGGAAKRYLDALFDKTTLGFTDPMGQAAGRNFSAREARDLEGLRGVEAGTVRQAAGAGRLDQPDLLRGIAEGTIQAPGDPGNAIVQGVRGHLDRLDAEGAGLGFLPKKLADSEIEYFPRHSTGVDKPTAGYGKGGGGGTGGAALPTDPAALGARDDFLRDIPGGTDTVNKLATDPELSGINGRFGPQGTRANGQAPTTPLQREAMVRARGFGWTPAEETAAAQAQAKLSLGGTLTPDEARLLAQKKQSGGLARYLEGLDPRHAEIGQGVFANHPLDDAFATAQSKARRNAAGNAIHDMIADAARPADQAGPNWIRVDQALQRIQGFDDPVAAQMTSAGRIGQRLGGAADLTQLYVPPEAVSHANSFLTPFRVPEILRPLTAAVDWLTNLTKTAQTALFPGFHARNLFSGQFANAMMGAGDPRYSTANPLRYLAPMLDAGRLLKGETIEGLSQLPLFRGLTDEAATKALGDLAYQYRVAGQGMSRELAGTAEQVQQFMHKVPGLQPRQAALDYLAHPIETLKGGLPHSLEEANPLNVSGVSSNTDLFAPVRQARQFGGAVEDTNRLSGFIGLLRQGYAPEEAGALARAAHVDYANLSNFERGVMKRVMPFYSYTRGIVPFTVKNIAENPGGLAGQTAMGAYQLQQEHRNELAPDWMGSGLAIPLGAEAGGNRRFLTKIDTPAEASFDLIGRTGSETAQHLLGMTNPLIKAPLELATGKQFFTGRDLADLYPITGNQLVDQVVMNSPLSRLYTTARTLADPRKWENPAALGLNLLTGARVNDVDMEKARDLQARELISDALRGQPGIGRYETIYPRQDTLGSLTPQDVALLRLNATLEARAKAEAEQKRLQPIGLPR